MRLEKYTFTRPEMLILNEWYKFICEDSFGGADEDDEDLAAALRLKNGVPQVLYVELSREQMVGLAQWYDQADCCEFDDEIAGSQPLADRLRLLPRLYKKSDYRVAHDVRTDLAARGCKDRLYRPSRRKKSLGPHKDDHWVNLHNQCGWKVAYFSKPEKKYLVLSHIVRRLKSGAFADKALCGLTLLKNDSWEHLFDREGGRCMPCQTLGTFQDRYIRTVVESLSAKPAANSERIEYRKTLPRSYAYSYETSVFRPEKRK